MNSTLVIVLAETRGHRLTYEGFEKNLLDVFSADLALCVADNAREEPGNPFYRKARYVWRSPEWDDWGEGLERVVGTAHPRWRELLRIGDQWWGGVRGQPEHPGSGGILIYFRAFLRQALLESGVLDRYDRLVITRSDFRHDIPHPPPGLLDRRYIWIPDGERYGGYTDRHVVVPAQLAPRLLSVADIITREPESVMADMAHDDEWNLEKVLRHHYRACGLESRIRLFPYTMYSVREPGAHTRWKEGTWEPGVGAYIKYRSEYRRACWARDILGSGAWTRSRFRRFALRSARDRILVSLRYHLNPQPAQ